jgi:molecular chaperone GrpE
MALFKRGKGDTDEVEDSAESTIEVKASVIADAIADADRAAASPRTGIAADGLVSVNDLAGDPAEPGAAPGPRLDQALAERKALVQLCLYALDRARSPGVVERLEEGLAGVGVTSLRPDGIRFDPAFHEAGGTVATTDEELDGVVAETEVVGFSDRGEVLRAPIVTVYSKAAP